MEERSLRITGANTNFFSKLTNTLTKIINPTTEGINTLLITAKRNNILKAFENYKKENNDAAEKKYEEAYTAYLETLDKYVLNSIYKKVSAGVATEFQKNALSQYYGIVQLKDSEYTEYKYRKQKYLIEIDYENIKASAKDKVKSRFQKFYIAKMDELYKKILKNYSIKLADNIDTYDSTKELIYTKVFITVEEYIKNILTLKIEDKESKQYDEIVEQYQKFEKFLVGKLDTRDNIEKNLILLGLSRKLFTHSLPLVVAEQCYIKLLRDARSLVQDTKIATKREKAYALLMNLKEEYNVKLLSTKVYWDNLKEREKFKTFIEKYNKLEEIKSVDEQEYQKQKEILFLKEDLSKLRLDKRDYTQLIKYYKRRLVDYGAMTEIKNKPTTKIGKYIKEKEKCIN